MVSNVDEYIKQGEVLYSIGNFEEAKKQYKKAVEADSMNINAYFKLSEAYIMLDDYEKAEQCLENILLIEKENAKAYFYLGNISFLKDDIESGKSYYSKAIHFGFSDVEVFVNYATICEEQGDYQEALKYYNKAIIKDKFRADIRLRKAQILIAMNKTEEALETLDVFIELDPNLFEGYHLKFLIFLENERIGEAEDVLNKALGLFPDDEGFWFDKILLLQAQQKVDEALQLIESKFSNNDSSLILREKVKIYLAKNEIKPAIDTLKKMISLEEEFDEQSRFYLAFINIGELNYEEALKYIEEIVLKENQGMYYYASLYLKGQIIKQTEGEQSSKLYYKGVLSTFRDASLAYPDKMDLIVYRGLIYKELKNYERALEMANYLLAISEDFGEAYLLRSQIYEDMGEIEKSKNDKQIAISKNVSLNILGI